MAGGPMDLEEALVPSYNWGSNSSSQNRLCGVLLGPTTISKMVSEPLPDPLGHLPSGFPNCAGREGVC